MPEGWSWAQIDEWTTLVGFKKSHHLLPYAASHLKQQGSVAELSHDEVTCSVPSPP